MEMNGVVPIATTTADSWQSTQAKAHLTLSLNPNPNLMAAVRITAEHTSFDVRHGAWDEHSC